VEGAGEWGMGRESEGWGGRVRVREWENGGHTDCVCLSWYKKCMWTSFLLPAGLCSCSQQAGAYLPLFYSLIAGQSSYVSNRRLLIDGWLKLPLGAVLSLTTQQNRHWDMLSCRE